MSRTKVIPLESSVFYSFEDDAIISGEIVRADPQKKLKPARLGGKKPKRKRSRKHNRSA